jgi:hypothetical protein
MMGSMPLRAEIVPPRLQRCHPQRRDAGRSPILRKSDNGCFGKNAAFPEWRLCADAFCRRPIKMSPLCHNRDRPLQALEDGAMVDMGTIRKEGHNGVPLLLGVDILTEAGVTAIPSADREEKVSWTDRCSRTLHR